MSRVVAGMLLLIAGACKTPFDMNPTQTQSTSERDQFSTGARVEAPGEDVFVATQARYREQLYQASADPLNGGKQVNFLDTGMAVSDLYCDAFLSKLARQQAQYEAIRDYSNLAGGVAAAALGLAGGPAGAIAGVGVGSAAVDSALSQTEENFLVAPDIPAVQKLVQEAREALRNKIKSTAKPDSFADAQRKLLTYDQQCGFVGIKRLVNEAVQAGKITFKRDDDSKLAEAEANAQRLAVTRAFGKPSLTERELAALYAYYVTGDAQAAAVKAKIDAMFPGRDLANQANQAEIQAYLQKLAGVSDIAAKASTLVQSLTDVQNAATTAPQITNNANQQISVTTGAAQTAAQGAALASTAATSTPAAASQPDLVDSAAMIATTSTSVATNFLEISGTLQSNPNIAGADLSALIDKAALAIDQVRNAAEGASLSDDSRAAVGRASDLIANAKNSAATDPAAARDALGKAAVEAGKALKSAVTVPAPSGADATIQPSTQGGQSLILKVE
jgi:hypothetical protein